MQAITKTSATETKARRYIKGKISIRVDDYFLNNRMLRVEVIQHSDSVGVIPVDDKETNP